jgi:hypothetical protein
LQSKQYKQEKKNHKSGQKKGTSNMNMKTMKQKATIGLLTLALALTVFSARPTINKTQPLTAGAEAQAVGGSHCSAALGIAAGLAIAALSPCSIVCAVGAWYVGVGGTVILCE